jgi:Alcohol dehydrogenase GroES-like domain
MHSVQVSKANGPFEIVEGSIPESTATQVRIRVQACGICHSDSIMKQGLFPGVTYPRVPGRSSRCNVLCFIYVEISSNTFYMTKLIYHFLDSLQYGTLSLVISVTYRSDSSSLCMEMLSLALQFQLLRTVYYKIYICINLTLCIRHKLQYCIYYILLLFEYLCPFSYFV